jgi:four helix bundle protein
VPVLFLFFPFFVFAEGFERESIKEFIRYLYIAKGSCGELRTQILIAYELQYIDNKDFKFIYDKAKHISSLIANLIKYLKTLKR